MGNQESRIDIRIATRRAQNGHLVKRWEGRREAPVKRYHKLGTTPKKEKEGRHGTRQEKGTQKRKIYRHENGRTVAQKVCTESSPEMK